MPIETDSGNIDFVWKFSPNQDGQAVVSYPLRLHKTADYGWTVSFLDEEGHPLMSLPAEFFSEVADHISPYMNPTAKTVYRGLAPSRTVSSVGLPQIGGKKPPAKGPGAVRPMGPAPTLPPTRTLVVNGGKKIEVVPEDAEADFNEEDATYLPPGHDASQVELDDNDPIFQTFTVSEKQQKVSAVVRPKETEVDPAQILEERAKAAANPNRKPGIKKRHSDE